MVEGDAVPFRLPAVESLGLHRRNVVPRSVTATEESGVESILPLEIDPQAVKPKGRKREEPQKKDSPEEAKAEEQSEDLLINFGRPRTSGKKVGINVGSSNLIEVEKISLSLSAKIPKSDLEWLNDKGKIKNLQFKVPATEIETSKSVIPRSLQLHIMNNLRIEKESNFIMDRRRQKKQSIELFKTTKLNENYYYVMPKAFAATIDKHKVSAEDTYRIVKDENPRSVDFSLFNHQKLALEHAHQLVEGGSKSFIFQMPPGGGKTLVAQLFCNELLIDDFKLGQKRKPNILIVVDTKILFIQWIQEIQKLQLFGEPEVPESHN